MKKSEHIRRSQFVIACYRQVNAVLYNVLHRISPASHMRIFFRVSNQLAAASHVPNTMQALDHRKAYCSQAMTSPLKRQETLCYVHAFFVKGS